MAKVLLVDDSPLLLKIGKSLLEKCGHAVVTAQDGAEAVMVVGAEKPGIVFMDAEMPGIDGISACRTLKDNAVTKNIPVFICTGHDLDPEQTKKFSDAGAVGWLQKPYKAEDMTALIDKHAR
jgi:twitching motility two-component system response regulator PilH